MILHKPLPAECGAYYWKYINLVPEGDVTAFLGKQKTMFCDVVKGMDPKRLDFAYAPGKWTAGQVIIHCIDTERIFAYRALALSRGEQKPIPGFDQDEYMHAIDISHRTRDDMIAEFEAVRDASVLMFDAMTSDQVLCHGTVSGNPMSVRAIAYIVAGHLEHHLHILRTLYLPG